MEKIKVFNDENQIQKVNNVNSKFTKKKKQPSECHKIHIKTSPTECIPDD